MPIYQTSSFVFDDADHAASLFNLQLPGFIYSRLTNPTVSAMEERIAALEDGRGATATSSGHAAQILALFPLMHPGDEIIAANKLYGGSINQMGISYKKFGWNASFVDPDDPENFRAAITDKTKAIFIESLANPGGVVVDIEAVAAVAQHAGIPLIVDNTMATPYLCKPFEHGADIIVHSTTKFLSGNGKLNWRLCRRFRQFRFRRPRKVPEPLGAGRRVSRSNLRRDLRRPCLYHAQPRCRPSRSRRMPIADQRLDYLAWH